MHRREFLRCAAVAGTPIVLGGCAVTAPIAPAEPSAADALLEDFELSSRDVSRLLQTLGSRGADFGEVYLQRRRERRVRALDGEILSVQNGHVQGAGLRVVRGDDVGFAVSEGLDARSLATAAEASATTLVAAEPMATSPLIVGAVADRYPVQRDWQRVSVARRRTIVERLDALLRQQDVAVASAEINFNDVDEEILIVRLDGRVVADRRPMTRLSVRLSITDEGVTHVGFASLSGRRGDAWYTDDQLQTAAEDVVRRTRQLFDARMPPGGELPVILAAGGGGVVVHEIIGHALEADLATSGSSPFRLALGESVANTEVTVIDNPSLPGERGSLNVDDEGEAAEPRTLIDAGTLTSYVHDRYSARAGDQSVPGSGRRESFRHAPLPRMSNTYMDNGRREPGELLEAMGRGVIAESITGGAVDRLTGRFRFRVKSGWFVDGGRKRVPVRDFEISGAGPEFLGDVSMVANDWRMDPAGWTCGKKGQTVPVSQGTPSILVNGLDIRPLS